MSNSALQRLQARYGPAIDSEISSCMARSGPLAGFYGMMLYQLGYVNSRLEPEHSKSAKRFRPLLCLLCIEAVGGAARDGLRAAAAIE
ncbi:MAG: hypothetical protein JOZ41_20025, partial [Chloroflexi bacterium]|nr:hypothetical protein [Chloroflexota bacterium]